MRDQEVVAAIVAGNPDGLAAAYDTYAAPLYSYCRSILREPADAADAVQDTFVIAASRVSGLRDTERLRPWLYAVARNECRRRLRAQAALSALDEAQDVSDETADIGGGVERAELRALLRAAALGLNPAEQEVVELQLRQGLDPGEIADVLGISRNHAHALISRARDQLEVCLGVLLVAKSGRGNCADLNALLEDWDGKLNVLLRKRLHRHIDRCEVCSDRKRSALRPVLLLGLAPLAALPVRAMAPPGLREQVLHLAASTHPDAIAHRAAVAGHAGAFAGSGFPKPLDPPKTPLWHARPVQIAAAVATAAAVAAAVVTIPSGPSRPAAAGSSGPGAPVAPGETTGPSAPSTSPAGPATPGQTPGAHGVPTGQPVLVIATSPGAVITSPGSAPSSSARTSTSAPASPSASKPGPSPTGSTTPTRSTSSPAPQSSPPVQPGTLSVSPATVVLSLLGPSQLTIRAQGGPVSWSVSEPSSLLGKVNFAPASGTLQAGQSAVVNITVAGLASLDSVLIVNPGGLSVTIVLGVL
ncbi:MAG TPA: sigma-70 family RNA polymerase sigma factor [Streptosporangiaceae bacterium]|nr:sigma-70 family RNA polymerase sigma factor [Streptosporangiaceae bacterium]